MRRPTNALAVAAGTLGTLCWCGPAAAGTYNAFGNPQAVTIEGYSASAMEPFISSDGRYLLFNTSNQPPSIPALEAATRVDAQTFKYQGEVLGANEAGALSGTPALDNEGNLYFISNRSYESTLSTVYVGRFASGEVTGVHLVLGVSGGTPGTVDFDVAVSPDGSQLYVAVGQFDAAGGPKSAVLSIYDRTGGGFVLDPHSARLLAAVNKAGTLDYAAAVSGSGLELFFTRASLPAGTPAIYRATRRSVSKPFGAVQRVGAITGFAEAPSLSSDTRRLYYHELVGGQFEIQTVTRP